MKSVRIKSYLRKAILKDVLLAGNIKENREVFYKSVSTNKLEGPYTLNTNKVIAELFAEVKLEMIYVIDQVDIQETSIPFKLSLVPGTISDLKLDGKTFKYYTCFYILNSKREMQGPFHVSDNTNKTKLYKDLQNNAVYILNKQQTFELITLAQTA